MYVSNLRIESNALGGQIDLYWKNPTKDEFPNFKGVKIVRGVRLYPEITPPMYSADSGDFLYDGTLVYEKDENFEEEEVFSDTELHGETVYYYTFYTYDNNADPTKVKHFANRKTCISAMATSNYNYGDKLYQLMPAIYKQYDKKEELRRLLEIFGHQLDLIRSYISGNRNFFNLDECDGELLSLLSQWIGWHTNPSLDINSQRNDIRYAPELYKTIGIAANLRAVCNRLTNWDSQIKEFFHNIFYSNNPEQFTIWSAKRQGDNWTPHKLVTMDEAYEGKLSTVRAKDGRKWLFYHARSDTSISQSLIEEGAIADLSCIWYKIYDQTEWFPARRVTLGSGLNRYPTALQKSDGNFWVFWSASRQTEDNSIQQIKLNLLSSGSPAKPAYMQGTESGPFTFNEGDQLKIKVDDSIPRILTFSKEIFPNIEQVSTAEVVTFLDRALPDVKVKAADDGTIILVSLTTGSGSAITVPDSIVATKLGLGALVMVTGTDATAAELIGSRTESFSLSGTSLVLRVDQDTEKTIDFTTESFASEVAGTINKVVPDIAQDDNGRIKLTSPTRGEASFIGVNVDSSSAAPELGFGAALLPDTPPVMDIEPAVLEDNNGDIWLFYSSRRSGIWKIWYDRFSVINSSWGIPRCLTKGLESDRWPAVLFDSSNGGRIWVFWSRKKFNRRWNIFYTTTTNVDFDTHTDADWTEEQELEPKNDKDKKGYHRKELAAILSNNGNIEVYFSCNRTGSWNVWYKSLINGVDDWTDEMPATSGHFTKTAPAIFEDEEGSTCLLCRSNESIVYSSKVYPNTTTIDSRFTGSTSIDTRNKERTGERTGFEDIIHYTYDTGKENIDWYAHDTIGIYLTPDTEDQQLIVERQELIKAVLNKFLPIQLRAVIVINPIVHKELIYTYDFPLFKPQRLIEEQFFNKIICPAYDAYLELTDGYKDRVPDWIWLRSWEKKYSDHRTVNVTQPPEPPVDTRFRTWHTGLESGG